MGSGLETWEALLRSVEKRRSYDARFYKPVCLIAAVDGVAEGEISPSAIDPVAVIERFRSYVLDLYPERADLGWRPFWHLSNDGAWLFTKNGVRVAPSDFGIARKPDSRGQLLARIDRVAVPDESLRAWNSPVALSQLREAALGILDRDDDACRALATKLRSVEDPLLSAPLNRRGGTPIEATLIGHRGAQGFQSSSELRIAVERHAMAAATELLRKDGWHVQNVSAQESYDLLCIRDGDQAFVEVKGTTGAGDSVILTRAEVEFAQGHGAAMILIVVSHIEVHVSEPGGPVVSGGRTMIRRGWSPEPGQLQPISYMCSLVEMES